MVNRVDPDVYEVLQGVDLLDPDLEFLEFGKFNYTAGFGAFVKDRYSDDDGKWIDTVRAVDVSEFLVAKIVTPDEK